MQFRADVLASCNTGILLLLLLLLLLQGLAPGSLILADLGYFSFPWFDYLTGQGFYWVSRLKQNVTYELKEVLAYDDYTGLLDAIVWLGKYRADRAAYPVRLLCFSFKGTQYRYLTNVLDPTQLSMSDIAQLYARRWDSELAFKLLKCELGLHIWWGARPELVLIQLWLAFILAQLLHARQLHVALQAEVEPFDVSMHRICSSRCWPSSRWDPLRSLHVWCKRDALSVSFAPLPVSRSSCLRHRRLRPVRPLPSRT